MKLESPFSGGDGFGNFALTVLPSFYQKIPKF